MNLIKSSINKWVVFISIIFGILVFSLGEIALNDISKIFTSRSNSEILKSLQQKDEEEKLNQFENQIDELSLQINEKEYTISGLSDDINSKKDTLDQLLSNQKINPNKDTAQSIEKYQSQFLILQNKKDLLKSELLTIKSDLELLERENNNFKKLLTGKYDDKVEIMLEKEIKINDYKVLGTQIILILLSLVAGIMLFLKFKNSKYLPPVIGYNIAIAIILAQAIYVHSPFRLHYYTFVFIGLVICIALIIWLIKNITTLSKKENLSIIKKSLIVGKCPQCSSNISLKPFTKESYKGTKLKSFVILVLVIAALFGNGSGIFIFFDGIDNLTAPEILISLFLLFFPWGLVYLFLNFLSPFALKTVPDPILFNNNNCPVCGLKLITKCEKCTHERHNLLPYCNNCGDKLDSENEDAINYPKKN